MRCRGVLRRHRTRPRRRAHRRAGDRLRGLCGPGAAQVRGDRGGGGRERWPEIGRAAVWHRVGRLELGEASVVVVVSTPRRPGRGIRSLPVRDRHLEGDDSDLEAGDLGGRHRLDPAARPIEAPPEVGPVVGADLAVDFGTERTLVAVRGRGVVAWTSRRSQPWISGATVSWLSATTLSLRGRCSGDVAFIRPVCHGQLADLDLTWADRERAAAGGEDMVGQPADRAVLCVRCGDRCAAARSRSCLQAGRRGQRPLRGTAGRSGARLRPSDRGTGRPRWSWTSALARPRSGCSPSGARDPCVGSRWRGRLRRGDSALLRPHFELVIDLETAEAVKRAIGSAWVEEDDKVEVRGRDVSNGIVRSVVITRTEVADAIAHSAWTGSCMRPSRASPRHRPILRTTF